MTPFETFTAFCLIIVWTIAFLPFISIDAAIRLQDWIREQIRKLENKKDKDNGRNP